ncbi:MAG: hypothetical protein QXP81_11230 [Nitrososphaerota archaeon]
MGTGKGRRVLEALRKAARAAAELTATSAPRVWSALPTMVYASGLAGIADSIASAAGGLFQLGGAVGAILLGVGAVLRFLPGTSADLRQTAMKMIEGGIILLGIIGTGALILGGAHWLGQQLAGGFGAEAGTKPNYLNPWSK